LKRSAGGQRGGDGPGHRHRSHAWAHLPRVRLVADDWDKVAAGTVAGHIIECGAQASGGNLLKGWRAVKGLADPGFPIVEASADGSFVITKHPGTGGWSRCPR
jgi:hypothetical protein